MTHATKQLDVCLVFRRFVLIELLVDDREHLVDGLVCVDGAQLTGLLVEIQHWCSLRRKNSEGTNTHRVTERQDMHTHLRPEYLVTSSCHGLVIRALNQGLAKHDVYEHTQAHAHTITEKHKTHMYIVLAGV
jgi:hypothetical protein